MPKLTTYNRTTPRAERTLPRGWRLDSSTDPKPAIWVDCLGFGSLILLALLCWIFG
jgi:hypothetical protein